MENRTFPNIPKLVVEICNGDCSSVVSLATALPDCTHAIVQASCGEARVTLANGKTPDLGTGEDDTAAQGMYLAKSAFAPDIIKIEDAKIIGTRYNAWGFKQP